MKRSGEKTNAHRYLAGKTRGKRSLRRPRNGWEDATKMYLKNGTGGRGQDSGQEQISGCCKCGKFKFGVPVKCGELFY